MAAEYTRHLPQITNTADIGCNQPKSVTNSLIKIKVFHKKYNFLWKFQLIAIQQLQAAEEEKGEWKIFLVNETINVFHQKKKNVRYESFSTSYETQIIVWIGSFDIFGYCVCFTTTFTYHHHRAFDKHLSIWQRRMWTSYKQQQQ